MLDVSDSAFRRLLRAFSRHAMLYTEMIPAGALARGKVGLAAFHPSERPLTLQLGGADPRELAEAARVGEDLGYDAIDLNAGCPSEQVQCGGFGAALLKDLPRLSACLGAMRQAVRVPLSVKVRIGVDDCDSEGFTLSLAALAQRCGCNAITVHARKAILHGLSPRENRSVPPLDYGRAYLVKERFPGLFVTVNGGIHSVGECLTHLGHADGVMLGRELMDNPLFIARVDGEIFGDGTAAPSLGECKARLLELAEAELTGGMPFARVVRPMLNAFPGRPGARRYRRLLSSYREGMDPLPLLEDALQGVEG
ncbi:MAG: tRNA dihydrouridine(20/20a) synthase DusA [Succinivibrionaceae bacterium]|nr:tRNA dihydrouridine(20/20a) synthase DusA [Succinivibrionaceae bacterium]